MSITLKSHRLDFLKREIKITEKVSQFWRLTKICSNSSQKDGAYEFCMACHFKLSKKTWSAFTLAERNFTEHIFRKQNKNSRTLHCFTVEHFSSEKLHLELRVKYINTKICFVCWLLVQYFLLLDRAYSKQIVVH